VDAVGERKAAEMEVDLPRGAELAKCRQFVRLCMTMMALADAAMAVAAKRDAVPIAELYDLLRDPRADADVAVRLLNREVGMLAELDEERGEMRYLVWRRGAPVAATREGLMQIAIHLVAVRSILDCPV
jgi:hypothetical protein